MANVTLLYFDAKAPTDYLDYNWDFSNWMAVGDAISSATVTAVPDGLVFNPVTFTSTVVTGWISSGLAGTEYTVTANIVTTAGRIASRSAILYVQLH